MNRRTISPIMLAMLTVMAVLPETPAFLAHAQPFSATLSVTPSLNAADVNSQFQVAVVGDGVSNVIGYTVSLDYDNNALSAVAVDFDTSTVIASVNHFNVKQTCVTPGSPPGCTVLSDSIGSVQYSVAALGGGSVTLANSNMLIVTFQVKAPIDSALTIDPLIAINDNGVTRGLETVCTGPEGPNPPPNCDLTVNNGEFLAPPSILLVPPFASVSSPTQRIHHIHKASDQPVHLVAFIMLDSNSPRPGFGGVIFDIIDPSSGDTQVMSSIAFMFPGNSTTVTGDYFFPFILGQYQVFVTPLRCPLPSTCVVGTPTVSGGNSFGQPPGFKVQP